MALATQCPHCQTTFRVAHDQLKLRAGLVRCGACKQIFNGVEHLLRLNETPEPDPNPDSSNPQVPTAVSAPTYDVRMDPVQAATEPVSVAAPQAFEDHVSVQANSPAEWENIPAPSSADMPVAMAGPANIPDSEAKDDPLQRMTLMDFTAYDESDEADATKQHLADSSVVESDDSNLSASADINPDAPDELSQAIDDLQRRPWRSNKKPSLRKAKKQRNDDLDTAESVEPSFVKRARRQQRVGRTMRLLMQIGSIFLVIGLLVQGAYSFRNQIAASVPQTTPVLARFCQLAGCTIGLPAQMDAVSIESSELQTVAANQNAFVLITLLRNRSATVQAWPNIELTLNDANEKAIARRVFTPREYLSSAQEAAKGFAANSEQPSKIFFELSQLKASGYRVYLFYP